MTVFLTLVGIGILILILGQQQNEFMARYKKHADKWAIIDMRKFTVIELRRVTEDDTLTEAERRGAQESLLRILSTLDLQDKS